MDFASVLLVLEVVGADVHVDFLADIGSGHLGTGVLAKELGEFVTDKSWLDEPRWLAGSRHLAVSLGRLGGNLLLTGDGLGKDLDIGLQGREDTSELLDLGLNLTEFSGG